MALYLHAHESANDYLEKCHETIFTNVLLQTEQRPHFQPSHSHNVVQINAQFRTFIGFLSICGGNSLCRFHLWFRFFLTFLGLCKTCGKQNGIITFMKRHIFPQHSRIITRMAVPSPASVSFHELNIQKKPNLSFYTET